MPQLDAYVFFTQFFWFSLIFTFFFFLNFSFFLPSILFSLTFRSTKTAFSESGTKLLASTAPNSALSILNNACSKLLKSYSERCQQCSSVLGNKVAGGAALPSLSFFSNLLKSTRFYVFGTLAFGSVFESSPKFAKKYNNNNKNK